MLALSEILLKKNHVAVVGERKPAGRAVTFGEGQLTCLQSVCGSICTWGRLLWPDVS